MVEAPVGGGGGGDDTPDECSVMSPESPEGQYRSMSMVVSHDEEAVHQGNAATWLANSSSQHTASTTNTARSAHTLTTIASTATSVTANPLEGRPHSAGRSGDNSLSPAAQAHASLGQLASPQPAPPQVHHASLLHNRDSFASDGSTLSSGISADVSPKASKRQSFDEDAARSAGLGPAARWAARHHNVFAGVLLPVVGALLVVVGVVAANHREVYETWRILFVVAAGACLGAAGALMPTTKRHLAACKAVFDLEDDRRHRVEENAARFIPADFLEAFNYRSLANARVGDHVTLDVAILFSDIRGFTKIAGLLDAEHTFEWINNFTKRITPIVRQHNGFVDKYLGDGMMTVFRKADDAVHAAVEMQQTVDALSKNNHRIRRHPFTIGVGIHWVKATFGMFGDASRLDTVLLGSAISIADLCEGLTKSYGTRILITEDVFTRLPSHATDHIRKIGKVRFKNTTQPTALYDVYKADPDHILEYKEQIRETFDQGLEAHFAGNFEQSKELFVSCLRNNLIDKLVEARIYFACEKMQDPPAALWCGEDEWCL